MALIPRRRKQRVAGGPARNVPTGTSYNASKQGIARPGPQSDLELGSAQPIILRELVPELATSYQRTLTYGKMMNDAGVDVSVRALKTPVMGAEFFIEPYSDDPQDQLISQFVWDNLAKGMTSPILNSLEDILHFFEDGFSVVEKVYEQREWSPSSKGSNTRQYTMLKKLAPRPASTIKEIKYDNNGGPNQLIQNAIQADGTVVEKTLDISKVMIFTFNRRGGDLTGKSILRTAYPHWYYKNHMYKIDAIQKERHGIGVPKGKLLPGFNAADKDILRTMLRNIRTNEESYIMETPNVEVSFAELSGQPVDVLNSASHHNVMIQLNVMVQFLVLGIESSGGGRATAGTGADLFMKSLRWVANYIAQVINMYLIPELVVWNFPSKNFPQLRVRNIGETRDLQMLGAALANLFAQQALTHDDPTENWIRDVFDMPHKQPGQATQPTQPNVPGESNQANGATPVPAVGNQGPQIPQNLQTNGGTQKGNVKITTGTGNTGKPPNAAQ